MRKRLISICIVVILVCGIYDCAQTVENAPVTETETVQTENTDVADAESKIVEAENMEAESKEEPETVEAEHTEIEIEEEPETEYMEMATVEEEYVQSEEEITFQTQSNAIDNMWRECVLTWQEGPDYWFFTNAQEGGYNLTLEYNAAFVVKDYALDTALEDEKWELKRIHHYRDDIYQACTESDMGSELYILFRENPLTALPDYIIVADIRKGDEEDITLQNDYYSYNSMLEWYSYRDWFDGKLSEEVPHFNATDYIHDSIYETAVCLAIYDYVYRTNGDTTSHWVMSDNDTYVGKNGFIACAHCSNGVQNLMIFVDVWNWTYAVLE